MATEKHALDQVIARIRFELEQLSSRNGQHEFEHLCRNVARLRICSNILPSTGPVSAGGDQGRDFETFRTYLQTSPIATSSFIGLASEGPVAFACTLTDKKYIASKIKSDIKKIMASGKLVIDIHYFCAADVPVGQRHKLQKWVCDNYNVPLEIHDGQAVSEYLADCDTFWIAEQYLHIPSEIYPLPPDGSNEEWYRNLLFDWKQSERLPGNYADFTEIKSAIHYATHTDVAKVDLPFWIKSLESLIHSSPLTSLKRKATYEIFVAALRGLGSLNNYEERLRAYFVDTSSLSKLSDIDDVTILWTYCAGACIRNLVQITSEELTTWREQIVDKIEGEISTDVGPGRRCALLYNRGYLCIIPPPGQAALPDFDGALTYWLELASIADEAPLFPLDDLADHLTQLLSLAPDVVSVSDNPKFHELTRRIDVLLSKRHGEFIAAEKCRDRAMALYQKGDILRALKEIHMAKIKWFAEETLKGSVLATLFASRCYQDLGLTFAAKYCALASAYICDISPDEKIRPYLPISLIDAAACDHRQGAFCGFFDLSDIGLKAFSAFSKIKSQDVDNEINRTVFHASVIHVVAKHLAPDIVDFVERRIAAWEGLKEYFDQIIPMAEIEWKDKTLSQLWSILEEQLQGKPFSDVGQERTVSFQALGVTWFFHWDNTYEVTCAAEDLLATLQVLLADLAGSDLCLLRTCTDIEIVLDKITEVIVEPIPSNTQTRWKARLSSDRSVDVTNMDVIALAMKLLTSVSVLPIDKLFAYLENAFSEGLPNKTLFGQRYRTLYMEFVPKDAFEISDRKSKLPPQIGRPFQPAIHRQLEWYDKPVPGYSKESAEVVLKNRYEKSLVPIKYTLGRLLQEPDFKATAKKFKKEGWRDWHILSAVALATVNYRVYKELGSGHDPKEYLSLFKDLI
ncbi:MAG: hypothetical protein ABSA18_14485, partial [Dehalococcoidia bacterium]